jgi:hypothetical protein
VIKCNKKKLNTGESSFELNSRANRPLIKSSDVSLVVIKFSIKIQNLKFVGLKMAKIQGSDGLMGKRNLAILNIDSILNKKFWNRWGAKRLVTTSLKWVYYVEFGWEMAVWKPKKKNSGWWGWDHLHLIRHFEVLKKKIFYDILL